MSFLLVSIVIVCVVGGSVVVCMVLGVRYLMWMEELLVCVWWVLRVFYRLCVQLLIVVLKLVFLLVVLCGMMVCVLVVESIVFICFGNVWNVGYCELLQLSIVQCNFVVCCVSVLVVFRCVFSVWVLFGVWLLQVVVIMISMFCCGSVLVIVFSGVILVLKLVCDVVVVSCLVMFW